MNNNNICHQCNGKGNLGEIPKYGIDICEVCDGKGERITRDSNTNINHVLERLEKATWSKTLTPGINRAIQIIKSHGFEQNCCKQPITKEAIREAARKYAYGKLHDTSRRHTGHCEEDFMACWEWLQSQNTGK